MTTKIEIKHAGGVRPLKIDTVNSKGEVTASRTISEGESFLEHVHAEQNFAIGEGEEKAAADPAPAPGEAGPGADRGGEGEAKATA